MHIPEGMVSPAVAALSGAGSAGAVAFGVSWVRKNLDPRRIVLMAVLGALIFALQMLNFPISGGTSGHFAGGALAGIVLGPWAAVIVLTSVLAVQAFVFADGGIIALGANVLNMAIVAPFVGYAAYRAIVALWARLSGEVSARQGRVAREAIAAFVAAWLGAFAASLAVVVELALSGTANFVVALVSMQATHAVIGVGEGAITGGLVAYLVAVRPDLLAADGGGGHTSPMKGVVAVLLALAIVAAGISFVASSNPDGLEWVYFDQGVGNAEAVEGAPSLIGDGGPLADYAVRGIGNDALSSALAGVVGLSVVGGLLLAVTLRKRPANQDGDR